MVVVARDQGHDPLSSEATVVVRIDDINDNAPTVTIRTLHGSTATELPESSAVGSFVAHVSVVDRDSAVNGHVNCSVNHPTVFTLEHKSSSSLPFNSCISTGRRQHRMMFSLPLLSNLSSSLPRLFHLLVACFGLHSGTEIRHGIPAGYSGSVRSRTHCTLLTQDTLPRWRGRWKWAWPESVACHREISTGSRNG